MTAVEGASRRLALGAFSRVHGGSLELVEPDGRRFRFGDAAADLAATIRVNSTRFYRAVLSGTVGLGEAYRDGIWDCDDLVALIRIACRNMGSLDRWRRRLHPLLAPLQRTVWR
ncbi:MAG: cyclopropane-fatty-acyl-phospholipid synthase, partial [Solirubrobacterales bacterium]|nr:cyclopropane-fatty-acyl-phospholipid synthase [Solirubrobacterales bacterium]